MLILVTGGAGYIGSVVTADLLKNGYDVIVLDNLQQGHRSCIHNDAVFVMADYGNLESLENVFVKFKIDAVMHLAADSVVSQSAVDPQKFFRNNVTNGINLLDVMLRHGVKKLVFSSSAAVYGEPEKTPIAEDHSMSPVNAYGETKLVFEKVLQWYGKAYGLQHISLRYFNAAGASESLGEDHDPETHLIPNVLKAALMKNPASPVTIFGTDYPTRDGSCIRDYVHVVDIARAHVNALQKISYCSGRAYNLGNGGGYSVMEVIAAAEKICGRQIPKVFANRRAGDPAVLVASSAKAGKELGWQPEFIAVDVIIESAWKWLQAHPEGYGER